MFPTGFAGSRSTLSISHSLRGLSVLETPQDEIERLEGLIGSGRDPAGRAFAPLADALRRAGELDRAQIVVQDGLARHGDFMSGWIVSAWVHCDAGRREEAGQAYERAAALDGENCVAILGLAGLAEARDDVEAALEFYREAMVLDHSDPNLEAKIELLEMAPPPAEPEPEPEPELMSMDALAPAVEAEPDPEPELMSMDALAPAVEAEPDPEPELMSMDALAPAVEAEPEPEPEPELLSMDALAPAADPAVGEMLTRSMGEVFAQQGLWAQAIDVYQQLLAQDPSDGALAARLAELKDQMATPVIDDAVLDIGSLAPDEDDGLLSIDSLAPDE
jgi:tetratricopeptide (TPR) repeat protein